MAPYGEFDKIIVKNARLAVDAELRMKKALNQPIAQFDAKSGQVRIVNGDGTVKVVGTAMTRGRYSERTK